MSLVQERRKLADFLIKNNCSLIPLRPGEKKPFGPWTEFQSRRATIDELFSTSAIDINLGIVTGNISGLVAVDLDSPKALAWAKENLPETPMKTKSASGEHWIYSHPGNKESIKNKVKFKHKDFELDLDIRADGGYVVAPLSRHPSGKIYEMFTPWDSIDFKTLPTFSSSWFEFKKAENEDLRKANKTAFNPSILKDLTKKGPAIEGNGGDKHTFEVACYLIRDCGLPIEEAFLYFQEWNSLNQPPWTEKDLRAKLQGAISYGSGKISREPKLKLTTFKELLAEPAEDVEWLLKDRLPSIGTSLLASKPKIGKTTLSRALAIAVANGQPFLTWATKKTPVIYIAAEENREQFKKSLAAANPGDVENLYIHTGPVPSDLVPQLDEYISDLKAGFIILDTLIRAVNVKDTNDYASMSKAMEPFQELAVKHKCQILLIHHAGKTEREHGDGVLGSTAIFGSVDTLFVLDRKNDQNYLKTIQRYGDSLDPHLLVFNKDTKNVSLGGDAAEIRKEAIEDRILEFLTKHPDSDELLIHDGVEGHRKSIIFGIRNLVRGGKVTRSGAGKKGDPFKYQIPDY